MSVKSKMTAIADIIRAILGIDDSMGLDAMATNLNTCHDVVDTQADLLDEALSALNNKAAGSTGSNSARLQSKTITPTETNQIVTADNGYDGLSRVSVAAISNTYIGSSVKVKPAQTYTPGTTDQVISSEQYLRGDQTIVGDPDLIADNIKSGIDIFGVIGTYMGDGGSSGTGTLPSGITAIASGTYTADSNQAFRVDINHGLSVTPNFCIWILGTDTSNTALNTTNIGGAVFYKKTKYSVDSSAQYQAHIFMAGYNSTGSVQASASHADSTSYFTDSTFGIAANSYYPLVSGKTYHWVCGLIDV